MDGNVLVNRATGQPILVRSADFYVSDTGKQMPRRVDVRSVNACVVPYACVRAAIYYLLTSFLSSLHSSARVNTVCTSYACASAPFVSTCCTLLSSCKATYTDGRTDGRMLSIVIYMHACARRGHDQPRWCFFGSWRLDRQHQYFLRQRDHCRPITAEATPTLIVVTIQCYRPTPHPDGGTDHRPL